MITMQPARDADRGQVKERPERVEGQAQDGEDGREPGHERESVGQDLPSAGGGSGEGNLTRNCVRGRGHDAHLAKVRGQDRQHARRKE